MTAIDEPLIAELLLALRAGAVITRGGSRAHSVHGCDAEGWYREEFDEGAVRRVPSNKDAIRELAVEDPVACINIVRGARWREVRRALDHGNNVHALAALRHWQALGDPLGDAGILALWLAPANTRPDAQTLGAIRYRFRSGTLFHLFMETVGWSRERGIGARGAAFVEALQQRVPEPIDEADALRARFLDLDNHNNAAQTESGPGSARPALVLHVQGACVADAGPAESPGQGTTA